MDDVDKLVCHIGATREWCDLDRSASDWFDVNERAHDILATVKTSIGNDHRWDRCKKYFNPYELISSSTQEVQSCAAYTPISRSYFKMIEMLRDHHDDLNTPHPCKAAFLCDAPGGFVEAFLMYRKRGAPSAKTDGWIGKDVLHAISLMVRGQVSPGPGHESVPGWRIPRELLRNNNVHLHGGDPSNNGDLYSVRNIDDFVGKVGPHSCEIVTADGGFDVSGDFNSQEKSSLRLLVSEVYTALRVLADGGALLIKMYDMRLPATIRLLWHLHCCFAGGIIIDKPCTSRAANSEKFVICRWFDRTHRVEKLVELLRVSVCRGLGEIPLVGGGRHLPPTWFLRELVLFNTRYIAHQTRIIVHTLTYMRSSNENIVPFPFAAQQAASAMRWCVCYGIPLRPQDVSGTNSANVEAEPADQPVRVPDVRLFGSVPNTTRDVAGTSDTHTPLSSKSLSPSTTPYKDGLLLPGRKLVTANCVPLPGGGKGEAESLPKRVAYPASGIVGTVPQGAPTAGVRPVDHPPLGNEGGRPRAARTELTEGA